MTPDNSGEDRKDDLTPEPERVELPDPLIPPRAEEPRPPQPDLQAPPTPAPGVAPPPPPPPPGGHVLAPTQGPRQPDGQKPATVTLMAALILVGGIWAVAQSAGVMIASACCWLTWAYALPVGIFAFLHGLTLLTNPRQRPIKAVPILLIGCIINCDVVTMTLGIVALVLMGSPEVKDYYEERGIYY